MPGANGNSSRKRRLDTSEILDGILEDSDEDFFDGSSDEYLPYSSDSSSEEEPAVPTPPHPLPSPPPGPGPSVSPSVPCNSLQKIQFSERNELLVQVDGEPHKYFELFISDEYLKMIVHDTNQYAEKMKRNSVHQHARISAWKELTVDELKIFLGLLLHTGTVKLNRLTDYWKCHRLYESVFSNYMSRNRFFIIMRCLHFEDDSEDDASRMKKCKKVIHNFNNTMKNIYYPGKNLSLDESMILWRGRLFFRQYIKGKRHKYGMKLYVLAEPDGTVLNVHVFASTADETAGKGHTEKIVFKLMEGKLDKGHSIYMDNYYNSFDLAKKLLARSTYCTGTLNKKRQGIPVDVANKQIKKGENTSGFKDDVHIGKWRDKREIYYISTEFGDQMEEVTTRRGTVCTKPLSIIKYNENMSGVDQHDQMLAYYPCERKTLRWYLKIFVHTLMLSMINAHSLYNKFSGQAKLPLYDFRQRVIEYLLPALEPVSPSVSRSRPEEPHKLTKIEKKFERSVGGKTVKATARKDCRNCYRNKRRTNTCTECRMCPDSPALCSDCFFELHSSFLNSS